MRTINVSEITKKIEEMCMSVNYRLSTDMEEKLHRASLEETSTRGRKILNQLEENLKIAAYEQIPICQDTGMVVVFIDVGQEVQLTGGSIKDAINEGVRKGYEKGYLRKSVVSDPIERVNTGDNTPAVIHFDIVPGDAVFITVAPKGFGSENMSRIYMLKPADGLEGIKKSVFDCVKEAGPNACPPVVLGIGIGGTFEECALLSKKALAGHTTSADRPDWVLRLEEELLEEINGLGIGPGGLGGTVTCLAVNILTCPTHIAGLPLAVNICCHVNRHISAII